MTTTAGKDAKGRFTQGNSAASGQRFGAKVQQFRAALFKTVTTKDVKAMVGALVTKATAGEGWALTLAFKYLLGEPASTTNVVHHGGPLVLHQSIQALIADQKALQNALALDERHLGQEGDE